MLYALLLKLIRVGRGYLTVMLPSIRLEQEVPCRPSPLLDLDKAGTAPSLLDLDKEGTAPIIDLDNRALPSTELLGDFIGFDADSDADEGNESAFDGSATQEGDKDPSLDKDLWTLLDNPQGSSKKIDSMIESNLSDFSGQDQYCSSSSVNCSGVSRRRLHGGSEVL
uniref:Uncharacterized protein n=1 Tax=Avena sativa TaxID=4498 RepID=A0ACD6A2X3_AVESA